MSVNQNGTDKMYVSESPKHMPLREASQPVGKALEAELKRASR